MFLLPLDWTKLPKDPLVQIFGFLDLPSLVKVAGVCRYWRQISSDEKMHIIWAEKIVSLVFTHKIPNENEKLVCRSFFSSSENPRYRFLFMVIKAKCDLINEPKIPEEFLVMDKKRMEALKELKEDCSLRIQKYYEIVSQGFKADPSIEVVLQDNLKKVTEEIEGYERKSKKQQEKFLLIEKLSRERNSIENALNQLTEALSKKLNIEQLNEPS